ncbi:hypothetical protein [Streptomyces roseochromogenus]|uniref:Uncharacterized protein n=1 Tax=Streptomyces roseochromogenus subsp. oscitans DS 12.976 TaxID=1352936 RepID=V6K329_STRRC|nr:hypothetical protein [Streptomyces roseochromogenus]EST25801.1 hypothetical protein M878_28105 [Streptomyces roseochromogenus subsp. oscitans DS 12.976]
MTSNQARRLTALLIDAHHNPRAQITTGRVMGLYQQLGIAPKRATARGDLKALARLGLLTEHGPRHRRCYALSPAQS